MKRLALTIATLLFAFAGVNAQYKMVVETNDGLFTNFCITDIKSITWQYSDPEEPGNNYEYVDLGLSVNWATCNVGATKPEEYGDCFAWGETSPKNDYNWFTYKYCNGSYTTMTKYCNISSYGYNGFTDDKTTLELSDDAARANWGGKWRMPTQAEFNELLNSSNCTWTWTTQLLNTSLSNTGSYGFYWSSSLTTDSPYSAWFLFFSSGSHSTDYDRRYLGLSVRPVCQ